MPTYRIIRYGSNVANQSFCDAATVSIIEAKNKNAAIEAAIAECGEGKFSVYANQWIDAMEFSGSGRIPADDLIDEMEK